MGHENREHLIMSAIFVLSVALFVAPAIVTAQVSRDSIYDPGKLKPTASTSVLKVGDTAPDFVLPSLSGKKVALSSFKGKKNVVISFVPAAWTPVCSQQWPGYNIAREFFDKNDAVLLGITVDNVPTLYAWTREMGKLWFPVLSDFWPHGAVAAKYGVLRPEGVSERALFIIDKQGVIRNIDLTDINLMPRLEDLVRNLEKLPSKTARSPMKVHAYVVARGQQDEAIPKFGNMIANYTDSRKYSRNGRLERCSKKTKSSSDRNILVRIPMFACTLQCGYPRHGLAFDVPKGQLIVDPEFIPGSMDLHNQVRPGGTLEFSCPVDRNFQSSLRDWKNCVACVTRTTE